MKTAPDSVLELVPTSDKPARLSDEIRALMASSLAPNTRRAYARAWNLWIVYLGERTPSDRELAGFLTELHQAGKSPATIAQTLAGIRFVYNLASQPIAGAITERTLAGIRREGRTRGRGQLRGIPWPEADLMVQRLIRKNGLRALRNALLISLMSDCLLRVSELTALRVNDLQKVPDGTGRLLVRHSKTDQEGRGATLFVGQPAMKIYHNYLFLLQPRAPTAPLIQRIQKGGTPMDVPLSDRSVRKVVKAVAEDILDAENVSSHSLRIGSAQSLVERGAGLVEVQQSGRWQSPAMPARYCRSQSAGRSAIARLRHGA